MMLLSDESEKERKGSKRELGQEGILILSVSHVDSPQFPMFLFFLMFFPSPLVPYSLTVVFSLIQKSGP